MRRFSSLAVLFIILGLAGPPAIGITVTISMQAPSVCTYATGSLYANVSGGVPPYSYAWNTGSTEGWIYDIPAGAYSVTVTDANSDVASANFTMTAWPLEAYVEGMGGCPDPFVGPPFRMLGTASIYQTGIPPLSLSGGYVADVLTDFGTGYQALYLGNFSGFPAAGTQLTIPFTDSNGCPGTIHGTVPAPPAYPAAQVLTIDAACAAGSNGSAMVQVGLAPNLDPYYISLIRDGSSYGFLEQQYTQGQMFGQVARTVQRYDLAPGLYGLIRAPRLEEWAGWLEDQWLGVGPEICTDTIWFTVPEMPGPCGTLKGTAYMDDNQDCTLWPSETKVPGAVMTMEPGGYTALTNSLGFFQINLPTGPYTLDQASSNLDEHCVGGPIPINLGSNGQVITQNMADTALTDRDVELMIGTGPARPGFNHDVLIVAHNLTLGGTGTMTITCTFDPALSYSAASPTPSNVSGNTLTWTLPQLNSFGYRYISVDLQVPANPSLVGTLLTHSATVSIQQPETILTNNVATQSLIVTASLDPNDKVAITSSQLSDALYYIDEDEWIDYSIRFQNTGTDTAFNVVITDTLPPTLDPATFQLGPRSHNCIAQMTGQGILRFVFPNILLPDSNVNEAASHGIVQFRIRPRLPLEPGTVIENIANIYFDFNEPVITEPSVLVAEMSTEVGGIDTDLINAFPNPAQDRLWLQGAPSATIRWSITSADGRVVFASRYAFPMDGLSLVGLAEGSYCLRLHTANGTTSTRFIKLQ